MNPDYGFPPGSFAGTDQIHPAQFASRFAGGFLLPNPLNSPRAGHENAADTFAKRIAMTRVRN
jgi:hypothetical protein